MAVSREQVVQIIKGVVASPYVDQVQDFIADLEATIAEQAKELSESQKHINHLRMALADAEALELGTCERLARARSMLAQQENYLDMTTVQALSDTAYFYDLHHLNSKGVAAFNTVLMDTLHSLGYLPLEH